MTEQLEQLIAKLKAKQLPSSDHMQCELEVTKFIAALPDSSRVFCRGEVRNPEKEKWYPAVLTYNTVSKQTRAWAPSGRKMAMEAHHEAFFHSHIPHIGIAREVLCTEERMTVPVPLSDS